MNKQNSDSNQGQKRQPGHSRSKVKSLADCCSSGPDEMAEMIGGHPCTGLMRGSRRVLFGVVAGAGSLSLVALLGWVLGVVAFFRTV
jgi:hypothetical protein